MYQIRINFKRPNAGMYQLYLQLGEKLQVYRGRARRVPKNEESLFNTVPLRFITSIELMEKEKKVK